MVSRRARVAMLMCIVLVATVACSPARDGSAGETGGGQDVDVRAWRTAGVPLTGVVSSTGSEGPTGSENQHFTLQVPVTPGATSTAAVNIYFDAKTKFFVDPKLAAIEKALKSSGEPSLSLLRYRPAVEVATEYRGQTWWAREVRILRLTGWKAKPSGAPVDD